jgi:hypothetical protein
LTSELKIDEDVDSIDFFNDFDAHVELNEAFILTYFRSNKNGRNNCFHGIRMNGIV